MNACCKCGSTSTTLRVNGDGMPQCTHRAGCRARMAKLELNKKRKPRFMG